MSNKALIFDMDGTLWDTTSAILPVWNGVLRKYSSETSKQITQQEMESYMGKTLTQIAEIALPELSIKRGSDILIECCRTQCSYLEQNGAIIYPNVVQTLNQLCEKYKICIVSNCQDGYIQAFIKYYNLENIVTDFECAGVTGKTKGENIRIIMERNNIEKAVYIGDTQSDFDAANQAVVPFVFAKYGFGNAEKPPYTIGNFSELLMLADNIL